jgi:hypothetical protein
VGIIGSLGPLFAGWMKDRFSHASAPGGLTYYGLLVLVHAALAWGVVFPLVYGIPAATSPPPRRDAHRRGRRGD